MLIDNAFPYGDIIIVAALAAFILLRYRAMLGEKSGRDKPNVVVRPFQDLERVIQLPERKKVKTETAEETGPFAKDFTAMRLIDRQFTTQEFVKGAKQAYEMVIEAFNAQNRDTLKTLLQETTYKHFADALDAQEAEARKQQTTLVALKDAEIQEVNLTGSTARIAVKFISEQVILVRDAQGVVVEGNPSHVQKVEDHWMFERNLSNADPAWKIVET